MTIPQGSIRVKVAIDDSSSQPPDAAEVADGSSLDAVAERLTAAGLVVEEKLDMLAMIIGTIDESRISELEQVPGVAFVSPEREIGLISVRVAHFGVRRFIVAFISFNSLKHCADQRRSVPGSAWDGTFRKLRFQLHMSRQSYGKVRSQAESGNE